MAILNCEACEALREDAPSFVCNGFTEAECTSLQNDTGLNPSSGNNDCTDLNNMVDCLIGNESEEVELYEVCDWKTFMKMHIENLWAVLKGIVCAICGLWTNVHNLWDKVNSHDCVINSMGEAKTFNIDGLTEAELGTGVQWRTNDDHVAYPSIVGNAFVLRVNGSVTFTGSKWLNFTGNTDDGNWLVYRYKLNKKKYGIKTVWNNICASNNAGDIGGYIQCFGEGETTPGQWGYNDPNGAVTVPEGYIYIEVRVANIRSWGITGSNGRVTITGVVPCLMEYEDICN